MARFRLFGRPAAAPADPRPPVGPPAGWTGGPPPGVRGGPPPVGYGSPPPGGYGGEPPQGYSGEPPRGHGGEPAHGYGGVPPRGYGGVPPVGAGAPWPGPDAGPATRSARPAPPRVADDPPTDPFGFPPIRAARLDAPAPQSWADARPTTAPDPAEAASLAGAFAVDYLSWDQEDPGRRGRVLLDYLSAPGGDPARLGWSGHGRQRAEFALTGLVRPDGDGRVLVDVRVRVTPYRSVGDHGADGATPAEPEPGIAGVPAVAPAPTGRGWRSLASYWIRLSVPVVSEGGRLVVDAWEETLGEELGAPAPAAPVPDDHTLADDDPLVEPRAGGAW